MLGLKLWSVTRDWDNIVVKKMNLVTVAHASIVEERVDAHSLEESLAINFSPDVPPGM